MNKTTIKQAVILAGGKGTRLRPLTYEIPKPMIPINSRPFLEYLLTLLKENGISEVIILLGYLAEKVVDYFGDGSNWGLSIKYAIGDISWETGTRISKARELLDNRFLLLYCDNYWPLNLEKLVQFHDSIDSPATVTVYTNKDGITRNNVLVDRHGLVIIYDRSRTYEALNGVDIGFFILEKRILAAVPEYNFSFEEVVVTDLVKKNQLGGFLTDHRYYSIGKPECLEETSQFLKPKKVLFLDRDGVINRKLPKAEYVRSWEQFVFLPGVKSALKTLCRHGYELYIITNQAGIARGLMTELDLEDIHSKMKRELKKHDVEIKGIYYCPHGWDESCDCRKPKPGLFYQAARENHLDITKAVYIGDDERDMEAGNTAGCHTFLLNKRTSLSSIVSELIQNDG
ncbi:MAG: HAD-IIIA family hydrolase [Spirochaetes bacterium]|nr:HAD-IIIA family hydrolase [Spirochaetota bacterium]